MKLFRGGKRRPLNLALQGGGAHGAFTWGVLDGLLEDNRFTFDTVSATSAGALNAVALASGMAEGGPERARDVLREVWEAVSRAGMPPGSGAPRVNQPGRGQPQPHADTPARKSSSFERMARQTMKRMTQNVSPYTFNPMDFNPLRDLLVAHINFDAIRAEPPFQMLIAATDVQTGRARFFREHEIDVSCVLASACLPTLHQSIVIDGRAYWDGGFSANPDLVRLAEVSRTEDTLLVLLAGGGPGEAPTAMAEITGEMNRLTFSQPLMRDIEMIRAARAWKGRLRQDPQQRRLASQRHHMISAEPLTSALSPETKLVPEWSLLRRLQEGGRSDAERWLATHGEAVGVSQTSDLSALFLG